MKCFIEVEMVKFDAGRMAKVTPDPVWSYALKQEDCFLIYFSNWLKRFGHNSEAIDQFHKELIQLGS